MPFTTPRRTRFSTAIQPLVRLVAAVILLGVATGSVRAERILLDWSEQVVNEAPAALSGNADLLLRGELVTKIVDAKSDPANPLPDSPLALFVQSKNALSHAAIFLSPFFHQEAPKKGWVEMEFSLADDGMIMIRLGAGSPDPKPSREYDGTVLYTIHLQADKDPLVVPREGNGQRFFLSPPVMGIEPHKIRIVWDFEGEKPVITLLLNEEPLLKENGPVALGVDPAASFNGIDRINISVRSGFLGKLTVSE